MYMQAKVRECDFDGNRYSQPVDGAWVLAQGATGRVCPVMFAGPEYLARNNIVPITREEAEATVATMENAWVDF